MLGRNVACLGRNAQPREEYGRGLYGRRGGQITWRARGLSTEGGYRGGEGEREENTFNREGTQTGPRRDPNAIDVDKERKEDRTCYVYGKWGHMAKNY